MKDTIFALVVAISLSAVEACELQGFGSTQFNCERSLGNQCGDLACGGVRFPPCSFACDTGTDYQKQVIASRALLVAKGLSSITSIAPDTFTADGVDYFITVVDLSDNALTEIPPNTFDDLSRLNVLLLGGNQLGSLVDLGSFGSQLFFTLYQASGFPYNQFPAIDGPFVDLSSNNITSLAINQNWYINGSLNLQFNPLSCEVLDGVVAYNGSLVDCQCEDLMIQFYTTETGTDAVQCLPPTVSPTSFPTSLPSRYPTKLPTAYPTTLPTAYPTSLPTAYPTTIPTTSLPTQTPTNSPLFVGNQERGNSSDSTTLIVIVVIVVVVLIIAVGIAMKVRNKRNQNTEGSVTSGKAHIFGLGEMADMGSTLSGRVDKSDPFYKKSSSGDTSGLFHFENPLASPISGNNIEDGQRRRYSVAHAANDESFEGFAEYSEASDHVPYSQALMVRPDVIYSEAIEPSEVQVTGSGELVYASSPNEPNQVDKSGVQVVYAAVQKQKSVDSSKESVHSSNGTYGVVQPLGKDPAKKKKKKKKKNKKPTTVHAQLDKSISYDSVEMMANPTYDNAEAASSPKYDNADAALAPKYDNATPTSPKYDNPPLASPKSPTYETPLKLNPNYKSASAVKSSNNIDREGMNWVKQDTYGQVEDVAL